MNDKAILLEKSEIENKLRKKYLDKLLEKQGLQYDLKELYRFFTKLS